MNQAQNCGDVEQGTGGMPWGALLAAALLALLCLGGNRNAAGQKSAPPPAAPEQFSIEAAEPVMRALQEAMVSHDRDGALAVFDPERMTGYAAFAGALGAMFERYDSFRAAYRIVQVIPAAESTAGDVVIAQFTLEAIPADERPSVRHGEQLLFSFARKGKQWKIMDVQPRTFFASF
jgi:hypothetical protein